MIPPSNIATTIAGSSPPLPRAVMSEAADTVATATSAVLTEPTANLGGSSRCMRNGARDHLRVIRGGVIHASGLRDSGVRCGCDRAML
jgi:hypothetical protein